MYDAHHPDRSDLSVHVDLVRELGARTVLDVGCGTGTLAIALAERGCDVVAVDPAGASLDVARARTGAERVRWVHGDATAVPDTDRDLALMTGNTAQAISDPEQWAVALRAVRASLRRGGHLVLETRDPAARAWEHWARATPTVSDVPGEGRVTRRLEVTDVSGPLVSVRWTWVFERDGTTLTSTSTLRFRGREELAADLRSSGYDVVDVRNAPGQELVVVARRRDDPT